MNRASIIRRRASASTYTPGPGPDPDPVPGQAIPYLVDVARDEIVFRLNSGQWYRTKNSTRAGVDGKGEVPYIAADRSFPVNRANLVSGLHNTELNTQITAAKAYTAANPGRIAEVLLDKSGPYILEGKIDIVDTQNIIVRFAPGTPGVIQWLGAVSVPGDDYPWSGRFNVYGGKRPSQGPENRAVWTGTYPAGTRTIRLNSNADITNGTFTAGKYAIMRQERYPTKYDQQFSRWYAPGSPATGIAFIEVLVKIVAANPATNEVTMEHPICYDMDSSLVCRFEARPKVAHHIGFENINHQHLSTNGVQSTVAFTNAEHCWVKDCIFDRPYSMALNCHWTRHITWQGGSYLNPQNVGGGYNGYAGWVGGSSESFMKGVNVQSARHGPNNQSNSYRNVITQCVFNNSDMHDHNQSSMGCWIDAIQLDRSNSGTPFFYDTPTAENTIHDPTAFHMLYYNVDGGSAPARWNRLFRLGAFHENVIFANTRFSTSGRENNERTGRPAARIPLISCFGTVGGTVYFDNNHWGWDTAAMIRYHGLSAAQAKVYEDAQAFFDMGCGVTVVAGRVQQTGLYAYPGYDGEDGGENYVPEVPSDYKVEFRNQYIYGVKASKLWYGFGGRLPVVREGINVTETMPSTGVPKFSSEVPSFYEYMKAESIARPAYWAVGDTVFPV